MILSNREHPLQVSGYIVNTRPSGTKPPSRRSSAPVSPGPLLTRQPVVGGGSHQPDQAGPGVDETRAQGLARTGDRRDAQLAESDHHP